MFPRSQEELFLLHNSALLRHWDCYASTISLGLWRKLRSSHSRWVGRHNCGALARRVEHVIDYAFCALPARHRKSANYQKLYIVMLLSVDLYIYVCLCIYIEMPRLSRVSATIRPSHQLNYSHSTFNHHPMRCLFTFLSLTCARITAISP